MDRGDGPSPDQLRALARPGRRRKQAPVAKVTVVLTSGEAVELSAESALGRAIGQVSALLAHW